MKRPLESKEIDAKESYCLIEVKELLFNEVHKSTCKINFTDSMWMLRKVSTDLPSKKC